MVLAPTRWRPFEEAREFVRALNLGNQKEWNIWRKSGARPDNIPSSPHMVYKNEGWVSLGDWLGTGFVAHQNRVWLPFEQAREFAQALNLSSKDEWTTWSNSGARPDNIPANPAETYKGHRWVSWGDWLGTGSVGSYGRVFLPFEEARAKSRAFNLRSQKEWKTWSKSGARPDNIPSLPSESYKGHGWVSWGDWLGNEITGWSLQRIQRELDSITPEIFLAFPQDVRQMIFMQNGLLKTQGAGKLMVKPLMSGTMPGGEPVTVADIENLIKGEPSRLDPLVNTVGGPEDEVSVGDEEVDIEVSDPGQLQTPPLPLISTNILLSTLDTVLPVSKIKSSADEEAMQAIVNRMVLLRWERAFRDEEQHLDGPDSEVEQARLPCEGAFSERVNAQFLSQYDAARAYVLPRGFNGRNGHGGTLQPTLMQRLVAVELRVRNMFFNGSGAGAGKTLSALLASRDGNLTVIVGPNRIIGSNTVLGGVTFEDGWLKEIKHWFPDSVVAVKDFDPDWDALAHSQGFESAAGHHRYLLLNYEAFQQRDSAQNVRGLLEREQIDLLVLDELQMAKQRYESTTSRRRDCVMALRTGARDNNPDLRVLGMSATPVINNLTEGIKTIELLTGNSHAELGIRATLNNCIALRQQFLRHGLRQQPDYSSIAGQDPILTHVELTAEQFEAIRQIYTTNGSVDHLAIEEIQTRARLPVILEHVRPKTLIYSDNIGGTVQRIDSLLADTIRRETGLTVGFFTGEDKTGLHNFIHGDLDVLIATSAISTGVDGLQTVCNTLITNVLPWTETGYYQLVHRIVRIGQRQPGVKIVVPLAYGFDQDGNRWSKDDWRMAVIEFKKTIANAVVDGIVPMGHWRSVPRTMDDCFDWRSRLADGDVRTIERPVITVPLPPDPLPDSDSRSRARRYGGDFSDINGRWSVERSDTTHARLLRDPVAWAHYHTKYREARETWGVVPFERVITWCQEHPGLPVVGDFGCGEAFVAAALQNTHTVHSFDHIAINDSVVECDISEVPLADKTLDVAILSLALMGTNFNDYLRQAHRTLKTGGWLHLIEPTKRFQHIGIEAAKDMLRAIGFEKVDATNEGLFTFIEAIKRVRPPVEGATLEFNPQD